MKLTILSPEELKEAYESDLQEAFPPAELKPLAMMEKLRERGVYDPLCLFSDTGERMGYILIWKHEDGRYLLIDYLCVPASQRNGGNGPKLLQAAFAYYPDTAVFLGESEAPAEGAPEDDMARRRLRFYDRNGAVTLGYECAQFGVRFRNICWSRSPLPPEEEILRHHQEIYLTGLGQELYSRYIQLPLRIGESPFPVTDWPAL